MRAVLSVCLLLSLTSAAQERKKGDVEAGKTVFRAKCAECHAADSKDVKDGPGLQGTKDGELPSGAKATREIILELVNGGRDAMPAFKDILTEQQKEDVVAYVMTL
jgi:mono/diheme cytochrome c family protein